MQEQSSPCKCLMATLYSFQWTFPREKAIFLGGGYLIVQNIVFAHLSSFSSRFLDSL
jgi:hypothetical protein